MIVYLSGPFARRDYLKGLRDRILRETNWTVSSSWLDEDADGRPSPEKAERDCREVGYSDLLLKFPDTETEKSTGGKHQEMGFAVAASRALRHVGVKRYIAVVGPREGILDYLPAPEVMRLPNEDDQSIINFLQELDS